jgi:hypothetical protein
MASATASRRLMHEYRALTIDSPEGITAGPIDEDNVFEWEAMIQGPEETPFEGGIFPATLTFPKDYPLSPPSMKFTCEVFHPNGESAGSFLCRENEVNEQTGGREVEQNRLLTSVWWTSIPLRSRLHLDPASPRGRSEPL